MLELLPQRYVLSCRKSTKLFIGQFALSERMFEHVLELLISAVVPGRAAFCFYGGQPLTFLETIITFLLLVVSPVQNIIAETLPEHSGTCYVADGIIAVPFPGRVNLYVPIF